jgi:putative endonuclease
MVYYVYVLESESTGRFYVGQSRNVAERLRRHNSGSEKSTAPFRPWRRVLVIEKPSRSAAENVET